MRPAALVPVLAAVLLAGACGDGGDDALPPFCAAYGELLSGPLADEGTDVSEPAVLEAAVASTEGILAELVDAAPPEVRAAATALVADYGATFDVLARYDYDLVRVQTEDPSALADLGGPEDDEAFAAVQDWVADHCAAGVTLPPDLTATTATTTTTATTP